MNGDAGLVGCLVDRIATRLPHRTGTQPRELDQDEIVASTRVTLVKISATNIAAILDSLITLLEELGRGYKSFSSHPSHVVSSEVYVLALASDCCAAHWEAVRSNSLRQLVKQTNTSRGSLQVVPTPLDDSLVSRLLNVLRNLLDPTPDGFILPAHTILGHGPRHAERAAWLDTGADILSQDDVLATDKYDLTISPVSMESHAKTLVEYLTASSWTSVFDHLRKVVYTIRTTGVAQQQPSQTPPMGEDDRANLVALRLISFYWVDSQKLGQVIQEICSSYLHLRRPFQTAIAAVLPLLVVSWLERHPHEFVQLHTLHKRLDGGADTLFDMTQAIVDNGRKKGMMFAMQITLLLLLPDVFEVASNLREAKSSSMAKKTAFLDGLRKSLRNKNEAAAYCLVLLLRAARHFDAEDDTAIVSFALDVQDEVKDAVFRRSAPNADGSHFEQDLLSAAFVGLAQLNPESGLDALAETCLAMGTPTSFRRAVVQGCSYLARQNDSHRYEALFGTATPYMLSQLQALDHPKALMACNVLDFLEASPQSLLEVEERKPGSTAPAHSMFEAFLCLVLSWDPGVRAHATRVAKRLFVDRAVIEDLRSQGTLDSSALKISFWRRSCRLIVSLCDQVMAGGGSMAVRAIYDYLAARVVLLNSLRELSEVPSDIPELPTAASKTETTLLVALCSADVETCRLVTSLVATSLEANEAAEASPEAAKVLAPLLRNSDIFRELGSGSFRFTGLVAFQKRMRGLLRRLQYPTIGILAAWEHAFERWLLLSREVSSTPADAIEDKVFSEWRNHSGFLASLGGICVANPAIILEEPTLSSARWIDQLPNDNHEEPLLDRYLRLSIQLLGCNNIRVREATRDVLSSDISPTLYQPMFRALESELEVLFTGALAPSDQAQDIEVAFAEQAISLLKALVERLDSPSDLGAASSVHLGALTLSFTKFMDSMADSTSTLRVKIKVCQLCETVNKRKEHLNLRDDVRIRNHLLEYIFGWIARPRTPRVDPHQGVMLGRPDDAQRMQKDLDRACLRSLAELTFRLPLQPGEGQTDAGASELKAQMFHTYFNRFLSLLNHDSSEINKGDIMPTGVGRDDTASPSELAITILSNLLSANIDVGLKHSLNIGYHDNVDIRTAFVKVLCNILIQGTEFSNLTDSAVNEKYNELLDLLTKDMTLVAAMSIVCPSHEVDELTISLLTIFEHRGRTFELIETLIKQEIEQTDNESEILRRTCVATKMLSVYAKWKGQAYLKATLQKVVERLVLTSKDLGLELDPARVTSNDELQKNALQLRIVAKVFIDDICASSSSVPSSFRQICSIVPPDSLDHESSIESFDFGSCVALHRFLYDHWDHIRQKLVGHERRDYVRSPAEISRVRSPVLEPLRNLITNLGPPPLAVTWNRPQVSTNTPPSYSMFQDFMLRNAFRGTESFLTARAVYDGGESKDGLSIICIILRHMDSESIDYETLIFCYLKNEPQDDLLRKLDSLTPVELNRNLTRVYVYNMNSAFRKCFRRILRVSAKTESSVFHPKNVEYHLIGSLQDLQAHFHLSQLHLPKETISVVTDTRYVFQPITRLSKTKGKIEVIIKVGSQFVQVTTTKKQEVFPGYRLSTTVNDIFRLGEVDEAPTSIQTEDDSAFGLRADNGRIVMYFTSPKKVDVLQTIRGAKAKYSKDSRSHKAYERLIRPQDVPGTLLNLALTNLSSVDDVLRLASYNLLGSLCKAFRFSAASKMMCLIDVSVPTSASHFIIAISEQLAQMEPQLTFDFLTEFFVGWESFSDDQKPISLAYMSPWLPGLRTAILANEADGDRGKEKIASLFRKLIDLAVADHFLAYTLEQVIWPAISRDETILDLFLEELTKAALSLNLAEESLDALSSIVAGMGTITLRARVISRLRKALNRTSLRPTKALPDNVVWAEICVLLHFCLSLSFDNGVQAQLFLPEIFHIVTMLANTGSVEIRILVHRLLVNTVHAACTSFLLEDLRLNKLRSSLDLINDSRGEVFSASSSTLRDTTSITTTQDTGPALAATESLAALLFEICSLAAPSVDISNAWRSRWMSLVASTAFQTNPAVQPRAFTVMGCLAREEVDDDLLYQVLVALRNSVGRLEDESNNDMFVSIVTSLSRMMSKLPSASRYGLQLFWLAISLLRLVPAALFNCTAQFLEAVLSNINTVGGLRGENMAALLMQGRVQLEEAAVLLDDAYDVHFSRESFHFAVCACLARGLVDTTTRQGTMRVLSSFLEMAGSFSDDSDGPMRSSLDSPYMALILARVAGHQELKDILWSSGVNPSLVGMVASTRQLQDISRANDQDLLLNTAIELVDFRYLEDAIQDRTLRWLALLAKARPTVVLHLCGPLATILNDTLSHCQNSTTLEAAHLLLHCLALDPRLNQALDTPVRLEDVLDDLGFSGLWRSCSMDSAHEQDRKYFTLTERLIEVS
ncbi:ras GTPase activator [Verticillium dahliae]|nr:ras GTPase activator [Verticillium dahliae]